MNCTIEFTCVPMGKKDGHAQLDVLIVPKCYSDTKEPPTGLLGWVVELRKQPTREGFTLNGKPLTLLNIDKLQSGLWPALFGDAIAGPKPNSQTTPLAPYGSRLRDVHTLSHGFYRDACASSVNDSSKPQTPDVVRLRKLHDAAIQNHGLYCAGSNLIDAGKQKDIAANVGLISNPNDVAFSENVAVTRLRAQPAVATGPTSAQVRRQNGLVAMPVRSPDAALVALSQLQVHYVNSKAAAASSPTLPAPQGSPHLLRHVSRLTRPTDPHSALTAYQVNQVVNNEPSFNQRITMLLNAPALLEALGLILHFSLNQDAPTGPIALDNSTAITNLCALASAAPSLRHTVAGSNFLPQPRNGNPQITPDGWMIATDGYQTGSLQPDSASMQIVSFATQSGLHQANSPTAYAVTRSRDEDVDHPILPPSPVTGGFYLWKHDLQNQVYQQRQTGTPQQLYAEDLQNSFVVDIVRSGKEDDDKSWEHLCLRTKEDYSIGREIHVDSQNVERGVRISSAKSSNPGTTQPMAYDLEETIFDWRYGSLVARTEAGNPNPGAPKPSSSVATKMPWKQFPAPSVEAQCHDSPLFGSRYSVSMRAGFVTGGVVPFDPSKADLLRGQPFLRYELMQGPALIPFEPPDNHFEQGPGSLIVGSKIDDESGDQAKIDRKTAETLLIPPRVSADLARWHGKSRDEIRQGTEKTRDLMRLTGELKPYLGYSEPPPSKRVQEEYAPYLPDPLVEGLWIDLVDLHGKVEQTVSIGFFEEGKKWPDFNRHVLQAEATLDPEASLEIKHELLEDHRVIRCLIPVGETRLLYLRPKLRPDVMRQHALACVPDVTGDPIVQLSYSDICRPTIVRVIHATDKPKRKAVIESLTISEQASGNKTQTQPPNVTAQVRVHPPSTSKVTLWAAWTEYLDDTNKTGPNQTPKLVQIASQDVAKRVQAGQTSNTDPSLVNLSGQLPFADSKHRNLRFTAVATARYGNLFFPSITANNPITSTSAEWHASRMAQAAPPPPDIEVVLPNFRWDIEKEHERARRMGLTLILNRPWFTSGENERLAVLTGLSSEPSGKISCLFADADKNKENTVSAWGLYSDYRATAVGSARKYIDLLDPECPCPETVAIQGLSYPIRLFTPKYNADDQQWYINLSFSDPPVYGAVVRLVVLRYQLQADVKIQGSAVALCDFAFLRPGRTVVVKYTDTGRVVEVRGIASPLKSHFVVSRFKEKILGRQGIFRYEQTETINGQAGQGNVLWTATLNGFDLGARYLIEEYEDWNDAEDISKTQSMPVYSDILEF